MAEEIDQSLHQKHWPEQEGSRSSRGQICCCVGGHQKQKLIDSMLEANKSLAKEIARLEGVEKTLKTTLMKRERTIKEKDRAFESLQDENAALVAKVEKQKRQLDNW